MVYVNFLEKGITPEQVDAMDSSVVEKFFIVQSSIKDKIPKGK